MANCSGRGFLDDQGLCNCVEGWASTGDLRMTIGRDCDVSLVFIRLAFAVGLMTTIFTLGFACYQISKWWVTRKEKGQLKSKSAVPPIIRAQILIVVATFLIIVLASLKLSNPAQRVIGIDLATTFVYTFFTYSLFLLHANVSYMFLLISIKQEKFKGKYALATFIMFIRNVMIALCISMSIVQTIPLAAVFVRLSGQDPSMLIQVFWLCQAAVVFTFGMVMPISLEWLCRDMKHMVQRHASANAEVIKEILRSLYRMRRGLFMRYLVNGSITLGMGIAPGFAYWSPYLIAIQCFLLPVAILMGSYLIINRKAGSSTSSKTDSKEILLAVPHREDSKDSKASSKDGSFVDIRSLGSKDGIEKPQ